MPIYEYQCSACGHTFDTLQKVSEAPLTLCPACGAEALRKLISPSAFRLKGGGWYETDFKTGGRKNVAQGEKGEKGEKGDKAAKADSKTTGESGKPAAAAPGATSKPKT